jgi:hypothetical protein
LEQANDLFGITACSVQVIVSELAPPLFDLAAHFLPLTFENVLVHFTLLLILRISCPYFLRRRSGQRSAPSFKLILLSRILLLHTTFIRLDFPPKTPLSGSHLVM